MERRHSRGWFLVAAMSLTVVSLSSRAETVREKKLRTDAVKYANDLNAMSSFSRSRTQDLIKECGHALTYDFDWSSIPFKDWDDAPGAAGTHYDAEALASMCATQIEQSLSLLCGNSEYKADYKGPVSKIKTVTCHNQPCDKLPPAVNSTPPTKIPGFEHRLSKDKTHLDVWFCQQSDPAFAGGKEANNAQNFLLKNL